MSSERLKILYNPLSPPTQDELRAARNAPSKISASQITRWKTCRRKWHLSAVHGLRTPSGPEADMGNRIHDALESYVKDGTPLDPDNPELTSARRAVVRGLIPEPRSPQCTTEMEFDVPTQFSEVNLLGFVDVMRELDTKRVVTDYKSKKNPKYALTSTQLANDLQMLIYGHVGMVLNGRRGTTTLQHIVLLTAPPYDAFEVLAPVTDAHVDAFIERLHDETLRPMIYTDAPKHWDEVEPSPSQCFQYRRPCEFAPLCFPGFGKPNPFAFTPGSEPLDFRGGTSVDASNPFNGREPQPLNPYAGKPPSILPPEFAKMNLTEMLRTNMATTKAPEPPTPQASIADLPATTATTATAPLVATTTVTIKSPDPAPTAPAVTPPAPEKKADKKEAKEDPVASLPKRIKLVLVNCTLQVNEGRMVGLIQGAEYAVQANQAVCAAHTKSTGKECPDARLIPYAQGTAQMAAVAMADLDRGAFDNATVVLDTQDPLQAPLIGLFTAHAKTIVRGR